MKTALLVAELLIALLLIGLILLQNGKGGLSSGVSSDTYRTKRGAERVIFIVTIVTGVVFFFISIFNLLVV
jgi:preprotein translocase subunit SecG